MSRGFGSTFGAGATDVATLNFAGAPSATLSMSFWYNRNGAGGGSAGRIFDVNGSQHNLQTNATPLYNFTFTFSTTAGLWTWVPAANGQWSHVLITYDNSATANNPIVYQDGVTVAVTRATAPVGTATKTAGVWRLGNNSGGIRNLDGSLAYFTLWNGAILDIDDATALFNGIHPLKIKPELITSCSPLDGINNPEPNIVGAGATLTGTRRGITEPPVNPFYMGDIFEELLNSSSTAIIIPPHLFFQEAA